MLVIENLNSLLKQNEYIEYIDEISLFIYTAI